MQSKTIWTIGDCRIYKRKIKREKVSGTIYLITERPPCPSCESVIKQFREMFPNIKLIVEDMYE